MIVLTRREILLGLAGVGLFVGCRDRDTAKQTSTRQLQIGEMSQVAVFSPGDKPLIDAVVDAVLPGAGAAGVSDYMAYWLAQKPFASTRNFVLQGLRVIDQQALRRFKRSFAACTASEQTAILKSVAEGNVEAGRFDSARFYQNLAELTLEGYLSDPRYGGNRDRAGWRFIGIPDGLRSCWWNPKGVAEVLGDD